MKFLSRQRAIIELIFAASLWGFSFIGIRWGLETFGPWTLTTLRFGLACFVGLGFAWVIQPNRAWRREWRLGLAPGIWLGITLLLQTAGLQFTSVTKSGFITILYIVFVPLLGKAFYRQSIPRYHMYWVGVALCGALLLCEVHQLSINLGDVLTLGCALAASMQILEVGRCSPRSDSAFLFTLSQAFWACWLPALGTFLFEPQGLEAISPKSLMGLGVLIFGSTLLAFVIQARAQRVLPVSTVSLLFLLESPFAAAFAFLLFGERWTLLQGVGGALILGAAVGTLRTELPSH